MLDAIGADTVDELYGSIPERLRVPGLLDLPAPLRSEYELRRHVAGVLDRNQSCVERLSFLGGGCWPHYVPAVCDEIVNRGEFLTAYYGDTYGDHGKMQALFEYASMLGELVECDAVSQPTYDWGAAAATVDLHGRAHHRPPGRAGAGVGRSRAPVADRGLLRAVGRAAVTIPFDREHRAARRSSAIREALSARHRLRVPRDARLSRGRSRPRRRRSPALAREAGALTVVGVDPISLGVLEAPPRYGADIVCGELQPLGIHMHYGGGLAGFVASSDTEQFVSEYPMFLIGLGPTVVEGEYGFGEVVWERTSYVQRGDSKEYTGTTQNLWAIAAGAYLAMIGPEGLAELGRGIIERARYAAGRLGRAARRPGSGALSGTVLQGVRGRLLRVRPHRRRGERARCASAGSSAGWTCRLNTRSSGRARWSASPRSTPRPT